MKRKIVLTVVLCLMVGFFLGFWLSGVLARKRIHRLRKMHDPRFFRESLFERINPVPAQAEQLDSLFEVHLYKAKMSRLKARKEMRLQYDSLYHSMERILDDKQVKELKKMRRHLRMIERRPPPPPPPGR